MVFFSRLTTNQTFRVLVLMLFSFFNGILHAQEKDPKKVPECQSSLGQNTTHLEVVRSEGNLDWVKFREGRQIQVYLPELLTSSTEFFSRLMINPKRSSELYETHVGVIAGKVESLPSRTNEGLREFAYDLLLAFGRYIGLLANTYDRFNVTRSSLSIEDLVSKLIMDSLSRLRDSANEQELIEDQIVALASHVGSPADRKILSARMIRRGDRVLGTMVLTLYAIVNIQTGKVIQIFVLTPLPGELAI